LRRIIIGIGNPGRTDDAIGLVVAERLKEKFDGMITTHALMPEDLARMRGYDEVVIVDGATDIPEGEVRKVSVDDLPGSRTTSHFIELRSLFTLGGKIYKDFPKRFVVLGIGIRDVGFGGVISKVLEDKIPEICEDILALLS